MPKKVDLGVPGVPVDDFVEEFVTKPYEDADGVQATAGIGRDGKEYGDPVPMSPPIGYDAPPDLMQMIRTMVHSADLERIARAEGFDSFEEAGDFDVEDDIPDPRTPHEMLFDPPPPESKGPQGAAPSPAPSPSASSDVKAAEAGGGGGSPKEAPTTPAPSKSSAST